MAQKFISLVCSKQNVETLKDFAIGGKVASTFLLLWWTFGLAAFVWVALFICLFVCFAAFSFGTFVVFLLYAHEEKLLLFALCCLFCLFSTVFHFAFLCLFCWENSWANNPRQRIEEKQNKTKQNVSLSRVKYFHKFRPLIACNVTLRIRTPPSWPLNWLQYFLVDKDKLLI